MERRYNNIKNANKLLVVIIVYILFSIISEISQPILRPLFINGTIDFSLYLKFINGIALSNFIVILSTSILSILYVGRLKSNSITNYYYKYLIMILIINYSVSVIFMQFINMPSFSSISTSADFNIYMTIFNIYTKYVSYILLAIQAILYFLILFKEGPKINWFAMGNLTALVSSNIVSVVMKVRQYLDREALLLYYEFDLKYPYLAFLATNQFVRFLNKYIWVIGVIIVIVQIKKSQADEKPDFLISD